VFTFSYNSNIQSDCWFHWTFYQIYQYVSVYVNLFQLEFIIVTDCIIKIYGHLLVLVHCIWAEAWCFCTLGQNIKIETLKSTIKPNGVPWLWDGPTSVLDAPLSLILFEDIGTIEVCNNYYYYHAKGHILMTEWF